MDKSLGKHKKYVKFLHERRRALLTTLLIFCLSGMLNFEVAKSYKFLTKFGHHQEGDHWKVVGWIPKPILSPSIKG